MRLPCASLFTQASDEYGIYKTLALGKKPWKPCVRASPNSTQGATEIVCSTCAQPIPMSSRLLRKQEYWSPPTVVCTTF